MGLLDRIGDFVTKETAHLTRGGTKLGPAINAHDGYVRVWLSHMELSNQREWFKDTWPALRASVSLTPAGRDPISIATVSPPAEGVRDGQAQDEIALSPLLPYFGGPLEVSAAVVAMKGTSVLASAIDGLGGFAALIGPPLSVGLAVADKVSDAADMLLSAENSEIALADRRVFTSEKRPVGPCYFYAVRSNPGTLPKLTVDPESNRLFHDDGRGGSVWLTGHDYIVIRVEATRERDDWRFSAFDAIYNEAIAAKAALKTEEFTTLKLKLWAAIKTSAELTEVDQNAVIASYARFLGEDSLLLAHDRAQEPPTSLSDIMKHFPMAATEKQALEPLSAMEFARL